MHNIQLGSEVISSEGEGIGKVDQVVIDPESRTLLQLIVQHSFFHSGDRILSMSHVERVDDEGRVHVNMTAAEAAHLPPFVEENYVIPQHGEQVPTFYPGGIIPRTQYAMGTNVETRHSVTPDMLVVDRGADVVDVAQKKLGTFDEIAFGDDGVVTGIVVRTGVIRHHELHVPIEQIAGVGADYVRLTLTHDEFETRLKSEQPET